MDLVKAYAAESLNTDVDNIRAIYDFGTHLIVDTHDGKRHRLGQMAEPKPAPLIRFRVNDPDKLISDHVWELLSANFEDVDDVYDAPDERLRQIPGIGAATLKNIRQLIGPQPEPNPEGSGGEGAGDPATTDNATNDD